MKVLAVTMFSPIYQPIADITLPVLKKYCEKHGYGLDIISVIDWNYSYAKHIYLKEKMKEDVDLFFYIDIDALITNSEIRVTQFLDNEHDLFITEDCHELNGGVFLLKNTEWANRFNDFILDQRTIFPNEQNGYVLYKDRYDVESKIKIVPHPCFNSYRYEFYPEIDPVPKHEEGNWQPNDFIMHVPGKTIEQRVEILKSTPIV